MGTKVRERSVGSIFCAHCVVILAVEGVYNHSAESKQVQVQVVDEIGPLTATNLCYIKGMYSVQTALGEVAHSGRWGINFSHVCLLTEH